MSSTDTLAGPSTKSEPRLVIGGFRMPRTGTVVVLLVALSLALRLWELGERPLHHDESLDAWWSWRFRTGSYDGYNPVYHGPLRFYITAGFYEMFGETDAVARLFSALTGTAVVGLPWFLRRELGRIGTMSAAAALAISPTMLYYSRFGREDAQMVFLTLLAMVLGLSYLRTPRVATATGLAFTLACSFAIKESTYLFGLLLAVFLLLIIAAQFDAQNRVLLGAESDPDKLNPAFISTALLFTSAGLTVAVVVGNASGELFPLIGLFMAALAAFTFVTALPQLRRAGIQWSSAEAVAAGAGLVLLAASVYLMRTGAPPSPDAIPSDGDRPAVWAHGPIVQYRSIRLTLMQVVGVGIAALGVAINQLHAYAKQFKQHRRAKYFGAAVAVAGILIFANDNVQGQHRRWVAVLTLVGACTAIALILTSLPRTTSSSFRWPATLQKLGTIGWGGWAVALGVFAVSWYLFFTVWGTRPNEWLTGVTEAVDYWDSQQEVNRGGQPWYYYLYALPIYEWFFVLLAVVGSWRGLRKPTLMSVLMVWFAVGSLILYSYAGERMPWLIAHPLLPMLVLAALGAQHLWQHRERAGMPALAVALGLGLLFTAGTSIRASFPNGADSREILSQAGQATPHVTAALDRLEVIDDISLREQGRIAILAIGSQDAWPYNWYLRDRNDILWFNSCDGPPRDGTADVIIINRTIDCRAGENAGVTNIDPPVDFPDYQPTLFAMRSWWVPTYNDAGPLGWLRYARNRTLWEQQPNLGFVGVRELSDEAVEGGLGAKLDRLQDGANSSASGFLGFAGADGQLVSPPPPSSELDDGRDGCGSVDQWFLVHNRFAFSEQVVDPGPTQAMSPLECVSDLLTP